jgi:hypothetical protein
MTYSRALVVAALVLMGTGSLRSQVRSELPSDFTLELLGRSLLYSFSYQYTIAERLGIEGGLSVIGGSGGSLTFLSGGAKFYLLRGNATPFIGGGIVATTASTGSGLVSGSGSYAYVSPGFEYRSSGGFLLRGTAYFLVSDGRFIVWPGLQVGIAF